MRTVALYRSQGYNISLPYKTFYASFEKPFYPFGKEIDIGVNYSHDNSGGSTFPAHYFFLNIAKKVQVSQKVSLSAGIQFGYIRKSFDERIETFPDQYNRDLGHFDSDLPTSELFEQSTSQMFSAGVGLLAIRSFNKKILSVGLSLQNINRPTEAFFGINNQTDVRYVSHIKMDYPFAEHYFVLPAFVMVNQGKSNQTIIGSNVGYNVENKKIVNSIMAGLFIRNGIVNYFESLIFAVGFGFSKWKFFSSYDFDISGLKSSYSKSTGFEFGLVYVLPNSSLRNIIHPSERF